MRNSYKTIAFILAIFLAVSGFSGCTSKPSSSLSQSASTTTGNSDFDMDGEVSTNGTAGNTSNSPITTTVFKEGGNVLNNENANIYTGRAKDLKGKTIKIQQWIPYMNGTGTDKLSLKARALNQSIEKQLNCKLQFVDLTSHPEQIIVSVQSGKPIVDIWWLQQVSPFINAYSASQLVELDSLKVIDFSNRARYTKGTDISTINGKHYGIAPKTYGIVPVYTNNMLFANLDILKAVGITDTELNTWQKSGQWTWSKFNSVCDKVLKNNKGYSTSAIDDGNGKFYLELMNANNTDWVSKNSNGSFAFSGGTEKSQRVLNYYKDLKTKGYMNFTNNGEPDFAAGKTAFGTEIMGWPIWANFKFNYSIMYPPKGPDASGYNTATGWWSFASIPKGTKPSGATNAEIATVLDLLNTPLLSDSESQGLAYTDMSSVIKNQLTQETILGVSKQGNPSITWSCVTGGIKMDYGDKGWYTYVQKIAKGELTAASAIQSITGTYNIMLKDAYKVS